MIDDAMAMERLRHGGKQGHGYVADDGRRRQNEGIGDARPKNLADWTTAAQRNSEVPLKQRSEPKKIALEHRLVEVALLAKRLPRRLAGELPENMWCDSPRQDLDRGKHDAREQ